MAVQGEQAQGGLDLEMLESMAQDEVTMEDSNMQVEFSPQPNPESEMGAGAEAAFDTPPPPLPINPVFFLWHHLQLICGIITKHEQIYTVSV